MGLNLKLARIKKGLTQEGLAKIVGVSHKTILNLEKNKSDNPTRKIMIAISEVLGVSVTELFFTEEDK